MKAQLQTQLPEPGFPSFFFDFLFLIFEAPLLNFSLFASLHLIGK